MQCRDFNLPFRSFGQGPVEFEKIAFVPSKFYYIYSVKMNKISFIYLCLNKQNVKNFFYELRLHSIFTVCKVYLFRVHVSRVKMVKASILFTPHPHPVA